MKDLLFYVLMGLALVLVFLGDALAGTILWFGAVCIVFGLAIAVTCLISNYREKKLQRRTSK